MTLCKRSSLVAVLRWRSSLFPLASLLARSGALLALTSRLARSRVLALASLLPRSRMLSLAARPARSGVLALALLLATSGAALRAQTAAVSGKRQPVSADAITPSENADALADERAIADIENAGADLESTASNAGPALDPDELARLLARYATEPSAAEVVAAALRAQQHDPARFAELASRARLRGLLPHLDLGVRRGRGIDLRSTTSGEIGSGTTADDLTLFATLRFDLGQLLMANAELAITREARYARAAQNQLVRQVVRLYFIRRRLLLERDWRGRTDLSHELRIAETEALLDTFTDGTFRRMIDASHGQPAQTPTLPSSGRR